MNITDEQAKIIGQEIGKALAVEIRRQVDEARRNPKGTPLVRQALWTLSLIGEAAESVKRAADAFKAELQ